MEYCHLNSDINEMSKLFSVIHVEYLNTKIQLTPIQYYTEIPNSIKANFSIIPKYRNLSQSNFCIKQNYQNSIKAIFIIIKNYCNLI